MKIKKDFVTNSSSCSFIFEDKRKDPKSLVIRFSGGCLNLFIPAGFCKESFKELKDYMDQHSDDFYSQIIGDILSKKHIAHIIEGENSNSLLFFLIELIADKRIKLPAGVKLASAIDQGEDIIK